MAGANDGHGAAIAFGTSGFAAALISIDGMTCSRDSIETSTMATTNRKTFIPASLSDPGSIDVTFDFDPALTPPIDAVLETITVTWPDAGAATWASDGFMTNYSAGAMINERMTASATIKRSGTITRTP